MRSGSKPKPKVTKGAEKKKQPDIIDEQKRVLTKLEEAADKMLNPVKSNENNNETILNNNLVIAQLKSENFILRQENESLKKVK